MLHSNKINFILIIIISIFIGWFCSKAYTQQSGQTLTLSNIVMTKFFKFRWQDSC